MHVTSKTVPGAAGAQGATSPRRLQEFFYKMGKDRSKLLTRGFSRSLIMHMTSASVPGAAVAPGATCPRRLQVFFYKMVKGRSRLRTHGFTRSLITNMSSVIGNYRRRTWCPG